MLVYSLEKYKAKVEYQGSPYPGPRRQVLEFKINAVIEVTQKDRDWWKGSCDGKEGWFPSQFVEEVRQVSVKKWVPVLGVSVVLEQENDF